jgi:hypothetical protein
MELAGLEPATSWVRSTDSPGGFRVGRWRLAGSLRTGQCRAISLDVRGLSAITRDSGTFGNKCPNESTRKEQGPSALRRASHDAPRRRRGACARAERVLAPTPRRVRRRARIHAKSESGRRATRPRSTLRTTFGLARAGVPLSPCRSPTSPLAEPRSPQAPRPSAAPPPHYSW